VTRAALVLLGLLLLGGCQKAQVQPFDPNGVARIEPPKDARAPLDGAFRDQRGRPVTLRALAHGRPIVLVPVQYRCPTLCGLTLTGVDRAALRQGQGFLLAALGIDPREGPAVAAETTARLKAPIVALTGPESAARAVTTALGFRYAWDARSAQYAHISAAAVLRPDGSLARWLPGPQIDPAALTQALDQAQGAAPAPLSQQLFLLCYHLVSAAKAHDRLVLGVLRGAGLASVLVLLLAVGGLILRERRGRARS
jgi:protein SCO1/2